MTKRRYPENFLPDLQVLLRRKYMDVTEPAKSGLPRVRGHIEISTRSKFGFKSRISDLVQMLVSVAYDETLPGECCVRVWEGARTRGFLGHDFVH